MNVTKVQVRFGLDPYSAYYAAQQQQATPSYSYGNYGNYTAQQAASPYASYGYGQSPYGTQQTPSYSYPGYTQQQTPAYPAAMPNLAGPQGGDFLSLLNQAKSAAPPPAPSAAPVTVEAPPPPPSEPAAAPPAMSLDATANAGNGSGGVSTGATVGIGAVTAAAGLLGGYLWGSHKKDDKDAEGTGSTSIGSLPPNVTVDPDYKILVLKKRSDAEKDQDIGNNTKKDLNYDLVAKHDLLREVRLESKKDTNGNVEVGSDGKPVYEDDSNTATKKKEVSGSELFRDPEGRRFDRATGRMLGTDGRGVTYQDNAYLAVVVKMKDGDAEKSDIKLRYEAEEKINAFKTPAPPAPPSIQLQEDPDKVFVKFREESGSPVVDSKVPVYTSSHVGLKGQFFLVDGTTEVPAANTKDSKQLLTNKKIGGSGANKDNDKDDAKLIAEYKALT